MKKIKELVMKDIGWKILALLIAFGLWLMVINTENPVEPRTYRVSIQLENLDAVEAAGMVVTNQEELENMTVSITVRGQRMSLDWLSQNRSRIQATADLSTALSSGDFTNEIPIAVDVVLPEATGNAYEIESRTPRYIYAQLDYLIEQSFPVQVEMSGNYAQNFVLTDPTVSPNTVTVSGASADVARVSRVQASVAIDSPQADFTANVTPVCYDSQGNPVTDVTISPSEIQVSVGVNRTKIIPINSMISGTPEIGYMEDGVEISPSYVTIIGDREAVESLNEITLPAIDISNATENVEMTYQLSSYLPSGVSLQDTSQDTVRVTVTIREADQRTIVVPHEQITVEGTPAEGYDMSYEIENISITLLGKQEDLDQIAVEDLTGVINVDGLGEGVHQVDVVFNLPNGVTIAEPAPFITVTVGESIPTSTTPAEESQNDSEEGTASETQ